MFCDVLCVLYWPFCHGAHKLDLPTLFTTFFSLNISSIYIISISTSRMLRNSMLANTGTQHTYFLFVLGVHVVNHTTTSLCTTTKLFYGSKCKPKFFSWGKDTLHSWYRHIQLIGTSIFGRESGRLLILGIL